MGHWNRIKIAKCQILITNFFVLLLGLSLATMTVVTHFGDHFTVIGHASLQRNPYETLRYWAFYVGISLAGLLSLGAALSTIATVREAHGLMAAVYAMMLCAFLWFAIHSYCGLDRRGRYSLTPRSHGCQPQEPSLF
ncbi:tetraspanin-32 isoform X10 [Rattus norvegicus]|uniref:tetraspanin-32 isoform X10 n=1 Tax=Rattus norvegicus TaxID=10116 RepID=UPI0019172507|nr:tetraspanin-32 isoform X8 [Rattus norvegicus]